MRKVSGGVCIVHPTNSRLVLAMTRNLNPWSGWALIGGKGEEGEDAAATALRETFEETGIWLQPRDLKRSFRADLEGWDTTFFLVEPTTVPKFNRVCWEGWVAWKPIDTILQFAPFHEYNRALFIEFGLLTVNDSP